MAGALQGAPALSTPDTHIFEDPTPPVEQPARKLSDEELYATYEIERTIREIRRSKWRRIALQFPDHMLVDAPRVFEALTRRLKDKPKTNGTAQEEVSSGNTDGANASVDKVIEKAAKMGIDEPGATEETTKLSILGDTSYGACCVDEIAAEHVDAEVVVHYGRSCLSPTARLPVIYVFTNPPLPLDPLVQVFKETYRDRSQNIILMADVPYAAHIPTVHKILEGEGYTNIYPTELIHNPSSLLPNRTVPESVAQDPDSLSSYALLHIADPPTALLLTLSSRLSSIHVYPVSSTNTGGQPTSILARTSLSLRRRYALLTSLSSASVFGILINTLSVANYQHIATHLQNIIRQAGKKSYTFVVGKVNAAKIANFAEVDGWVVVGCWESSLLENKEFWKPVLTPFELELALMGDEERVWSGEWRADFQGLLDRKPKDSEDAGAVNGATVEETAGTKEDGNDAMYESDEESAPPEFDLRTGRYVSHSRPLRAAASNHTRAPISAADGSVPTSSSALTRRGPTALASVGGEVSPGAEFLRSKRTWRGLGSDFVIAYEEGEKGAVMEQGRSGIARGYTVGTDDAEVR